MERTCSFTGCERPLHARGLCKPHSAQRVKGRELHPLGDRSYQSALQRGRMLARTPEEREAHAESVRQGIAARGPRSAEHSRRISESLRAVHAARQAEGLPWRAFVERVCRGCGIQFAPNSGAHWFCTQACASIDRRCRKHLVSRRDYDAAVANQQGLCALCGQPPQGWNSGGLHFDHCHRTGRFRALLCGECNTAIGRFGDDPVRLRAAASYLERYLD